VDYVSEDDAKLAMSFLNKTEFEGKTMNIEWAKPKKRKPSPQNPFSPKRRRLWQAPATPTRPNRSPSPVRTPKRTISPLKRSKSPARTHNPYLKRSPSPINRGRISKSPIRRRSPLVRSRSRTPVKRARSPSPIRSRSPIRRDRIKRPRRSRTPIKRSQSPNRSSQSCSRGSSCSKSRSCSRSRSRSPKRNNSVCLVNLLPGVTEDQLSKHLSATLDTNSVVEHSRPIVSRTDINHEEHMALVTFLTKAGRIKCEALGEISFFGQSMQIRRASEFVPKRNKIDKLENYTKVVKVEFKDATKFLGSIVTDGRELELPPGCRIEPPTLEFEVVGPSNDLVIREIEKITCNFTHQINKVFW